MYAARKKRKAPHTCCPVSKSAQALCYNNVSLLLLIVPPPIMHGTVHDQLFHLTGTRARARRFVGTCLGFRRGGLLFRSRLRRRSIRKKTRRRRKWLKLDGHWYLFLRRSTPVSPQTKNPPRTRWAVAFKESSMHARTPPCEQGG